MTTNLSSVPTPSIQPSSMPPLKSDEAKFRRWGWWIVIAGFGSFVLWALLAPLDQGIPVSGTVMVTGNKKSIQHLVGGTVERILVREGDSVRAGQTLVRMNAVQASANAAIIRMKYFSTRGAEARLLAERDGLVAINFGEDLTSVSDEPRVATVMAVQRQIFSARRYSLQAEIAAMSESIAGIEAQTQGLRVAREAKIEQRKFLREQLDAMRDLAREGFVPRNRLLELERASLQLDASVSEDAGTIARGQRQIGEIRLRQIQRQQEFQMEVRAQLAEAQKEASTLRSQLDNVEYELANTEVKAPVDGVVADVSVFTEGGVVAPGFRMMDVVPLNEPLIVQAQVPVNLVDSVRTELPAELIFSAFNQNTTPRIPGYVSQVSPDRLVDQQTGIPYFRIYATITPEGHKLLVGLPVRPGMPVDLFIKTGERTLANYLLKPVYDHFKMAMTEE